MLGKHSTLPDRGMARSYVLEKIDNSIHPSKLWLLLDLIEAQTAKGGPQVITSTHSSDMLAMIGDNRFNNTSVVCRLPDTDDSVIRPVTDLPAQRSCDIRKGWGDFMPPAEWRMCFPSLWKTRNKPTDHHRRPRRLSQGSVYLETAVRTVSAVRRRMNFPFRSFSRICILMTARCICSDRINFACCEHIAKNHN